ncbi:serine/threonine-protein kinase HipA [Abyssogena phaseoliformis symbiont OG214]|uniref:type II toxin-antitoxin system HipA family toxin n=1 Tax=Abyssogena phaseoliformis symbiont TaxID=596095 RepID=UPI0019152F66|nr:type II toxin-antitoxin system HipA family toxin [Abyssogena phaseoliformis symbiont]BBB22575.1 serine/threonine-protein kinase HipA [Abyssogena phaseoliformis symbiont OG214]
MKTSIKVNIFNQTVGYLSQNGSMLSFEYDSDFLNNAIELSPFMLPKTPGIHKFNNRGNDCFNGLPHFISDALPDKFGSTIISAYFAKQGRSIDSITILERLAFLGKKSIGALEFEPAFSVLDNSALDDILNLKVLVDAVKKKIHGELSEVEDILIETSSGVGGARAKALIGYDKKNKLFKPGQKDVPDGFEHYLIKFDSVSGDDPKGYGNVEYAYYLMAVDSGIEMTKSFLLPSGDDEHFMTKRFDRVGNKKIHTQTLCSIIGSDFNRPRSSNYASYFNLANFFNLGYQAKKEMFRRMVFNVVLANRDDHTKNFSFLIKESGEWLLAPAYDITHAYNNTNPNAWTKEHNLLINNKGTGITKEDMVTEGIVLSLRDQDMESIIKDVQNVADNFTFYADKAGVIGPHKDKIIKHLNEVYIDSEPEPEPPEQHGTKKPTFC